jgi:Protein of unknown function (DUF2948)
MEQAIMEPLKFVALDPDDLEVVSTHLQDAEVKVADVHWRPQERRLVIGLDRFDWQAWNASTPEMRRHRAALRLDRVLSCKCNQATPHAKDKVLNLLAVEFEATDTPGGVVKFVFSGGGALRCEVECLEVELVDLGPTRIVDTRPPDTAEAPSVRH